MAEHFPAVSVERLLKDTRPAPKPSKSGTVAGEALSDANVEDMRFLQDLSMEIPYSDYAWRGVTFQNFLRTRQLAFHDIFEEVSEEVKRESLTEGGEIDPALIREQEIYTEMCGRFVSLATQLSKPESDRAWLQRVAARNRRNLERFARTNNPELIADGSRAAAEILEREMPKQSRSQIQIGPVVNITPATATLLAKAFAEARLPAPPIPTYDVEVLPEAEEEPAKDPK